MDKEELKKEMRMELSEMAKRFDIDELEFAICIFRKILKTKKD